MLAAFDCSFIQLGGVCVTWIPILGVAAFVVLMGFLVLKDRIGRRP
jgi:hypothetical protein